jgi:hypothetical protein
MFEIDKSIEESINELDQVLGWDEIAGVFV